MRDIETLEYEKKHLGEMKRSSVEMTRSALNGLFGILFFIGIAHLVPNVMTALGLQYPKLTAAYTTFAWCIVVAISGLYGRRYYNLKNYKDAVKRMNAKLEKLRSKIEK